MSNRKGKVPGLGKPLTPMSAYIAEEWLRDYYDGKVAHSIGAVYGKHFWHYGASYYLGAKKTRGGWRVWATVPGAAHTLDPISTGTTYERYASDNTRAVLKRKLERCILEAREELRRRKVMSGVVLSLLNRRKLAHFMAAFRQQEALWGKLSYETMSVVQGLKWLIWIRKFDEGAIPLPPSRQLSAQRSAFQIHYQGLVLYEGSAAFWLLTEDDSHDRCLGDMVGHFHERIRPGLEYVDDGETEILVGSPAFYEALSEDFVLNWEGYARAYLPDWLEAQQGETVLPGDGYADGGEPYTKEELGL